MAYTSPDTKFANFDLVKSFKLDYADINVSKWRSRVTGLSVVHLDYSAPIVNGYFVVNTEIFDDSGCPHTLEHLVFMGSEKYPYKGIIDHLANRGFSNGTNAWTDTDHTAYTVSTAGEQGFLQILPIYVDHILYPTMTEAGFVTEVHHINGKGEDSGVVYSEMQGRENTSADLMAFRMQRLHFPPGSAYRSETGGLMKALRELTADKIRKYHASYYVPHNLTLIVAGKLASGTQTLLDVIQEQIEPSLIAHGQNKGPQPKGWKRPFLKTPSAERKPFTKTIVDVIEFPEKDESVGELQLSWLGPPMGSFLEGRAIDLLGNYLTNSATAPLMKEYVEIENPLCTYIYFEERDFATYGSLYVYVGSIPAEHLDSFDQKLQDSFARIASNGINMKRMAMVIDRDQRQLRSKLESSKGDTFYGAVINDALYGAADGSDLPEAFDEMSYYDVLRKWSSDDWVNLLKKLYYIDPHRIVLVGKPSAVMAKRLEDEEKTRLEKQKETLGNEGLEKAREKLEVAKAEHDIPIPTDILTNFPVPDVKSISWIPVSSLQEVGAGAGRHKTIHQHNNEDLTKHVQADGSVLPFFVQYDHVESDFVTVSAYISLDKIPNELRPYSWAYLSAFFSLPVTRASGEHLSHEEVVNQLDNDTVSYDAAMGGSGAFSEILRVALKVQRENYDTAVSWLRDLIYGSCFDKERLQVAAAKIQQALPEMKRDGNTVLTSVNADLLYNESSTGRAGGLLIQMEFIPKLIEKLNDNPGEVIKAFENFRTYLQDPSSIRFSVNGDILRLSNPRTTWQKHFGGSLKAAPLNPVPVASDTLSLLGKSPVKKAVVLSLPTIESSFVSHHGKGMLGWTNPDYPALRVAAEVLNATESYLWRYIRGSGLAYGASVSTDLESGLVSFSLYRSSNYIDALDQAKKVLSGLVDGSIDLEDTSLDAAKSAIVYSVTRGVSTPGRAANQSFINQSLKGVSQNHNTELLKKYQAVTKDDVLRALKEYYLPLFDPTSSATVVVTAPSKSGHIGEELNKRGYEIEQRTLDLGVDEDEVDGSESGSDSEMDTDEEHR
ncbi:Metalloenzyme, LuxS/M16 peptidase-like protein [Irpex rosettiformis]|uniref:Metalloenzyme, LuxS/M16 peptidase-like protein n=1 Tax=Irpex rosettiformis TaxID=378272 RepID=A0ACB8UK53_9APHY|nr:Metalloenzyme, LuxS/M16 peptidase-like protein [Irpex rosettiformis]